MPSKESPATNAWASSDPEEYDSDSYGLLGHKQTIDKYKQQKKRQWAFLAVNIFVLLLNLGLLLMISVPRTATVAEYTPGVRLPHTDWIAHAVEWEVRPFDDSFGIHGPFRGIPRPELDSAWAEPLKNYTLRVPKPGWQNTTSPARILTEFQDEEGGLMGAFSFLHNLHCLKSLREYMLPEYYPEAAKMYQATPESPIPVHLDHCIDSIRQSELCHADMSLRFFEWHEDHDKPVDIHHAPHICKNIDKVNDFMEAHSVPPFGSILTHPWTGKSPYYPD